MPRRRAFRDKGESLDESDVSEDLAEVSLDLAACEVAICSELKPQPAELGSSKKDFDISAYSIGRNMTPIQERWNAITIIPNAFYCLFYLFAGKWISQIDIDANRGEAADLASVDEMFPGVCIRYQLFPNLHALPPLSVCAVALGIILHCPCSFLYHWKYAVILPQGLPRIEHWSRRLDHSAIHLCSALWSYGTSGSWSYFALNMIYNADSIYRHFEKEVRPKRNQGRILFSMILYTLPLIWRGESVLFSHIWSIFAVALWLFAAYPLGGWSHSAFHVVMVLVPPILLESSCQLPESREQIRVAALCAASALRGL
uniref:Post-GPI attachment to proteins factor 3 n=1 Tax=Odontella aurita TaxID=265563 RepID=A0A7S4IN07_9STRA|mmetsp:Transcript_27644/g.81257  ORF Transcript_27644/g.81257 Transcript_27644/m.81257 type:complete len:315 (+) Transcript_27644:92-1036(+)